MDKFGDSSAAWRLKANKHFLLHEVRSSVCAIVIRLVLFTFWSNCLCLYCALFTSKIVAVWMFVAIHSWVTMRKGWFTLSCHTSRFKRFVPVSQPKSPGWAFSQLSWMTRGLITDTECSSRTWKPLSPAELILTSVILYEKISSNFLKAFYAEKYD